MDREKLGREKKAEKKKTRTICSAIAGKREGNLN